MICKIPGGLKTMSKGKKDERSKKEDKLRISKVAVILIILNVLVFFDTKAHGNLSDPDYLLSVGGLYWRDLFLDGNYIGLLLSMFLHSGWKHLIMNMLFLYVMGSALKNSFGDFAVLIIYFLSGISAGLISAYSYMQLGQNIVTVGASGAIYGLIGGFVVVMIIIEKQFGYIIVPFIYAIMTWTNGTDFISHCAGTFIGILATLPFIPKMKKHKETIKMLFENNK